MRLLENLSVSFFSFQFVHVVAIEQLQKGLCESRKCARPNTVAVQFQDQNVHGFLSLKKLPSQRPLKFCNGGKPMNRNLALPTDAGSFATGARTYYSRNDLSSLRGSFFSFSLLLPTEIADSPRNRDPAWWATCELSSYWFVISSKSPWEFDFPL